MKQSQSPQSRTAPEEHKPAESAGSIGQVSSSIELRDEKPPRSIGAIPGWLTRWNIAVTLLFFLGLILAVTLIPYPYSGGESILEHLLGR